MSQCRLEPGAEGHWEAEEGEEIHRQQMTFKHVFYLLDRKEAMQSIYLRLPFVHPPRLRDRRKMTTELCCGWSARYNGVFRASISILGFGAGMAWRK